MIRCKRAGCGAAALPKKGSVFQLCQRDIDALSEYVNRKPVWGTGSTMPSRRRYAGARRMFGWAE